MASGGRSVNRVIKVNKLIPFLKGHMGGNEIVLVPRERFSPSSELEAGLRILERPQVGGDQLGLLYEGTTKSDLRAKIVDINSRQYLPMCGGLTQVLGKAHLEQSLTELVDLDLPDRQDRLVLETGIGTFPLDIDEKGRTLTVMDSFIKSTYEAGVETGEVNGVQSCRVGDFFVTFEDEIKKEYPRSSFRPLDRQTKRILIELQEGFRKEFATGKENRDFAVMAQPRDDRGNRGLIFPHNLSEDLVEPSCGTGTVAVAMALVERESLPGNGRVELDFESGGDGYSIGGPDLTRVTIEVESGRIRSAGFTHDNVEIVAAGKLYL